MIDLERAASIALVTVFVARLIAVERGPYAVFMRLQAMIQRLPSWADELKYLVSCPICLSVWVSAVLVLLTQSDFVMWPAACALAWFFGSLGGWGR